jgi:hypothetical protein
VAIDRVTRRALRTPIFIAGIVMLAVGLVPVIAVLVSGWNGISGVSPLTVFALIGALLMALARSKASQEWRQQR